jgi:hypothetical protein
LKEHPATFSNRDRIFGLLLSGCVMIGANAVFLVAIAIFGVHLESLGGPMLTILGTVVLGGLIGAVAASWIMHLTRRASEATPLVIALCAVAAGGVGILLTGAVLSGKI